MNAPERLALDRPAIDGAQYLPIALCEPWKHQPRKRFDQAKLDELANSVEKLGVMQPILVRHKANAKRGGALYEIVAGERRWRACGIVATRRNETDIAVIPAIVRELTDFEARELATTENLQRDDLHPIEEAEGYEGLLLKPVSGGEFKPPRTVGYTVDELAARIGKSRGYVFGRLKLLQLIPDAREAFFEGKLSASVALMLARMPADVQAKALKPLVDGWGGEPYSARQASSYLHDNFMLALKSAVFDIADAKLVAKAGSCHTCPKRTGAAPELFDDVKSADVCTDSTCFNAKVAAHGEQLLEKARVRGLQVVTGEAVKKIMPYGEYSLDGTGHVNLDKAAEELTGTRKTLRSLLGDDFKDTIVVKADHQEQPMLVAQKEAVKAALKAKGLLQLTKKGSTGTKAKALTAEDIKKQRDDRVGDMLDARLLRAICKHLADDGVFGLPDESPTWMRAMASRLLQGCELDPGELGTLITGTHQPSQSTDWVKHASIEQLVQSIMAGLLSEHVADERRGYRKTDRKVSDELAKEVGFDLAAMRKEITHEVDSAIRDEIEALKPAAKPASTKKTAGAKTTPSPKKGSAKTGEGGEPLTPETALAAAVAKEKASAPKGAKKTTKSTSQKDKAAAPQVTPVGAWPFPKGAPA